MTDAVEVDPFSFVNPGGGDKDFSPYITPADEPEEESSQVQLVPKGPDLAPASSSPATSGGSEQPAPEPPLPTGSSPTSSDPTENPEETSTGSSFPLPATPPIPSSPSVEKTTPPAS